MRRSALADALAEEQPHPGAHGALLGQRPVRGDARHGVPVRAAPGVRRLLRDGPPRRCDAAGHGPRRAGAAARRPGPREPRLPHGRPARPGGHPARHRDRHPRGRRWRTSSLPTWRSSRTSIVGSTRRATPVPASPVRSAATRSPSTSPVGAWGNRDVPGRHPLRGGRVRRLPLRLVPRGDPGPGARRAAGVRRTDRRAQHARPAGVTNREVALARAGCGAGTRAAGSPHAATGRRAP